MFLFFRYSTLGLSVSWFCKDNNEEFIIIDSNKKYIIVCNTITNSFRIHLGKLCCFENQSWKLQDYVPHYLAHYRSCKYLPTERCGKFGKLGPDIQINTRTVIAYHHSSGHGKHDRKTPNLHMRTHTITFTISDPASRSSVMT